LAAAGKVKVSDKGVLYPKFVAIQKQVARCAPDDQSKATQAPIKKNGHNLSG
jgi:hypothetical protein